MSRDKRYATYSSLSNNTVEKKTTYKCDTITDINMRQKCIQQHKVVCIDLYADWCGPCKLISPDVDKLAHKYNKTGQFILVKENVDSSLPLDCNIDGIPAFVFYKDGKLVKDKLVIGGDLKKVEQNLLELLK